MKYSYCLLVGLIIFSCGEKKKEKIVNTQDGKKRFVYYDDGTIKSEVFLSLDEPHGTERVFYENGNLMEENNWVYGDKIGHQFKYYDQQDTVIIIDENGEPMLTAISAIKAYDYINSLGGISYSIEYDKSEGVIDQRGHTVVAYSLDKENIFKGDTLNVHLKFPLIKAEITPTLFSVEGKDQYRFIDSLEINYDYMKSDFSVIINSKITLAIISKMRVKSFEVIDTSFISTIEPNI